MIVVVQQVTRVGLLTNCFNPRGDIVDFQAEWCLNKLMLKQPNIGTLFKDRERANFTNKCMILNVVLVIKLYLGCELI